MQRGLVKTYNAIDARSCNDQVVLSRDANHRQQNPVHAGEPSIQSHPTRPIHESHCKASPHQPQSTLGMLR